MKIVPVAQAKAHLSSIAAGDAPSLITRNGRPVAVLVPVPEDADVEDIALSFSPAFRHILAQSRANLRRGEFLTQEELLAQLAADEEPQRPTARRQRRRAGGS